LTLRKTHYPSKNTIFLPPLSKGGGLTARHKLLLCCFLLAICPLFLYCKLFCRQDGGIALHHRPFQNRTIPRKRGGSVARSSRANYGGDCSCLEVVSLIPLVLFLFHIDRCTHSNSEPEKCCPTNSTIGSLAIIVRAERCNKKHINQKTFYIKHRPRQKTLSGSLVRLFTRESYLIYKRRTVLLLKKPVEILRQLKFLIRHRSLRIGNYLVFPSLKVKRLNCRISC